MTGTGTYRAHDRGVPKTSARLLALLSLLQSRRDWPGGVLADRLDISLRTVRRDVDRLRELGYPIAAIKGPDGGYRLRAGADLPPLLFDDEQAVALTVALQIAAGGTGGLAEPAARALTTIRQVLPTRLRNRVEALDVTAVERPTTRPSTPVTGDVLLTISTAVRRHEILRFDYGSDAVGSNALGSNAPGNDTLGSGALGSGDRPPRRAEPHHVVTWDGRWYLIAWDLDRDDWRTFRADRIVPRIPNGPRFTPRELPGGDVAGYVIAKFRGSEAGAGRPCRGTVLLDRPAAEVALYTRDGVVEEAGPGRCRLTLGSWSWTGLAAAVARYDADVEVVGPPELSRAFAHLAERFRVAGEGAGDGGVSGVGGG